VLAAALALAASTAWGVGDFVGGLKSRLVPALLGIAFSQPFGLAALLMFRFVRIVLSKPERLARGTDWS